MALPSKVLPGFTASMWMQTSASPFTTANLAVWTAQVATLVGTTAGGTGASGTSLMWKQSPHLVKTMLWLTLWLQAHAKATRYQLNQHPHP